MRVFLVPLIFIISATANFAVASAKSDNALAPEIIKQILASDKFNAEIEKIGMSDGEMISVALEPLVDLNTINVVKATYKLGNKQCEVRLPFQAVPYLNNGIRQVYTHTMGVDSVCK